MANFLIVDVEISPDIAYTFGNKWEVSVVDYKEYSHILGFSCKWLDGKQTSKTILDYKSERQMIKDLWVFFDTADLVIGWNSDKFDIKKINTAFAKHGFPPPSPYKSVDLIKTVRGTFALPSNKLDDFLSYFDMRMKLENEKGIFIKCAEKDKKSLRQLKEYNANDTRITEDAFKFLRPWIKNLNVGIYFKGTVCAKCGENKGFEKRGFYVTKTMKYQTYRCKGCGGQMKSPLNLRKIKPLVSV